MKTCVICISKNSHDTINEWVNHYLNLGFSNIFIIDNNEYNDRYIFNDERIISIPYHGEFPIQENGNYRYWRQSFIVKILLYFAFDQGFDYSFICDDDEYLDLKGNYENVNDFLYKHSEYDSISITWEIVNDNGYSYIDEEPNIDGIINRYEKSCWMHFECKSFYKIPKSFDNFKKDIEDSNNAYIMHNVTDRNRLHIKEDIIENNEVTIKHYPTLCMERFLMKKSTFKGTNPWLTNKLLRYYYQFNQLTEKNLNAYVDLCNKYNITISDDDKKILDEHNIKY